MAGLEWIGAAIIAIAAEAWLSARFGRPAYGLGDSETSLGLAFGWLLVAPLTGALTIGTIALAWRYRLVNPGNSILAWIALFLAADFLCYLWHRANHRLRWLWATHVVHHSAPRINFLASFRQGWTDGISGTWLFWAPLGLLGFAPAQCGVYFVTLLAWQFWVHNEWAPSLGPLEWLLVTPSGHRVHHSLKDIHLDRNFGGVLIIWDRLFGTYAREGERLSRFGLEGVTSTNPLSIALGEWRSMFRDARKRV
jgi:sterol desaturase/sphingolipid hydroxylase (fatty acid hydroxylase superfamily)